MYKVFFKDRIVFFENDFQTSFRANSGLFYKYSNKQELDELIHAFFKLEKIKHLYIFCNDLNKLKKRFSSCFKAVNASGGLVKNGDGKFLVIRRNNIWDLPKGKKNDPDEHPEITAIREVSEECGIGKLSIVKEIIKTYHTYFLDDEPILKETTWFEMHTSDKNMPVPQVSENITEVRWLTSGEIDLITKDTYPSIIEVLKVSSLF